MDSLEQHVHCQGGGSWWTLLGVHCFYVGDDGDSDSLYARTWPTLGLKSSKIE